jgi:hypothetical protein
MEMIFLLSIFGSLQYRNKPRYAVDNIFDVVILIVFIILYVLIGARTTKNLRVTSSSYTQCL